MLSYLSFHHIGIACFDIDRTASYYVICGYDKQPTVIDSLQNVKVCVLSKAGMPTVELLEPVNEKSPICNILQKSGVTPYHICYIVPDLDRAIRDLRKELFMPISKSSLSNVFNGKVCFLFNRNVGIVEILESKIY